MPRFTDEQYAAMTLGELEWRVGVAQAAVAPRGVEVLDPSGVPLEWWDLFPPYYRRRLKGLTGEPYLAPPVYAGADPGPLNQALADVGLDPTEVTGTPRERMVTLLKHVDGGSSS